MHQMSVGRNDSFFQAIWYREAFLDDSAAVEVSEPSPTLRMEFPGRFPAPILHLAQKVVIATGLR